MMAFPGTLFPFLDTLGNCMRGPLNLGGQKYGGMLEKKKHVSTHVPISLLCILEIHGTSPVSDPGPMPQYLHRKPGTNGGWFIIGFAWILHGYCMDIAWIIHDNPIICVNM